MYNETSGSISKLNESSEDYHLCSEEEFPLIKAERSLKKEKLYCFDQLSFLKIFNNDNLYDNQTDFNIGGEKTCPPLSSEES